MFFTIQTERGNINREMIKNNMLLEQAKEMLMLAEQELHSAQYAKIKNAAASVKNEVMEMIAKVRERKGRLDLPIVSGKHLRRISDRTALQSADNAEKFITTRKIDSFESLAQFTADREQTKTATELAYAEVISYNRKNLARELQNESRQYNRQQDRPKRREEEI